VPRYHVNPQGEPGICRAENDGCPYAVEQNHFPTKAEARKHYEELQSRSTISLAANKGSVVAYHGSPSKFEEFSYEHLGGTGAEHGWGFYFSDDYDSIKSYAENGYIYKLNFAPRKPMLIGNRTITKEDIRNLLEHAQKENGFLEDYWGDVNHEGYEKVIQKALNSYADPNMDDIEKISALLNDTEDYEYVYRYLHEKYGFDSIESNLEKGWKDAHIYVATHPSAFTIEDVAEYHSE